MKIRLNFVSKHLTQDFKEIPNLDSLAWWNQDYLGVYQNDGREQTKPHASNVVTTLSWSCDCWHKQQKDFWSVQIYIHHSDKCCKCDKRVLTVTQKVLPGQRCGRQGIHLSTEDIQIHRRAASAGSFRKQKHLRRGNLVVDSRFQKRNDAPSQEGKTTVLFLLVLHV